MNKKEIYEFFSRLCNKNPNPESDLEWTNAYTLLVAVTLSAQATDIGVNKATKELFKIVDTPQDMIDLGIDKLKDHIKTIGLYNTKAKNVMKMAEILVNEYKGEVPDSRDELIKLPGVGRKTANVVLNIVFKQPTMAVDTHIFRISNRTKMAPGKTPDAVEKKLEKVVPEEFALNAHHWLILQGRYVCKARKPDCPKCIVSDLCRYKDKTVE
ncbi:MAG: endonuclease III [Micavibrio sp. TMED27]|nr:endonuclease III [Micavibrio sp.]OUT92175.1 MAG: endonuclease III [Micavibrio sp. TMED27]|tara:strand:- start:3550 stop:4185 length:636 start_codon:yes stop_codon:yes gene_type:complete